MNYSLNNPIFYFFTKNNEIVEKKKDYINSFLKCNNLLNKKIVYDVYKNNKLKYKVKLNNLLLYRNNFDLCILSFNDLGRNFKEVIDIMKICKIKNIRIFDIEYGDFIDVDCHLLIDNKRHLLVEERRGSKCKGNLELY